MEENKDIRKTKEMEEQEIDIMALVKRLWKKRKFIVKVVCVFAVIGFVAAISSPNIYTSKCVVVPETKGGGAFSGSALGGLAAMAGINLGAGGGGEMISPHMYDKLIKNIDLCKELMHTPINFEGYEEPVTILDYYTNPDYAKTSVMGTIKKYTIGLPFTILGALKGEEKEEIKKGANQPQGKQISSYTKAEMKCIKTFSKNYSVVADKKNGDVTITAAMLEPLASAQVAERIQTLLQKYVIELKLQKAEVNYQFIKQRYDETKLIFEQKQKEYAQFQDANKALNTALAKAKEEQMRADFNVAKDLFNQLTIQLVQAEMKIKEDIPILTIVEPVQVPLEKSGPSRAMMLIVYMFLGGVLACGLVLGRDWLREQGVMNKLLEKVVGE